LNDNLKKLTILIYRVKKRYFNIFFSISPIISNFYGMQKKSVEKGQMQVLYAHANIIETRKSKQNIL